MTPKTEIELEKWMKDNCFNFNSYSINGNAIYEGFGIDKIGGRFIWYYIELGQKDNIKYFNNEKELIEYAYNQIKSDKWAKTHCIGFTTDKTKTSELANRLEKMNIEFMKDQIPYYGLERPVYRTFVFGCDYLKVSDLRKQYYEEK
ncbi:hypothetical protein [Roseivirga pacifica]|uniref:hypothetical protein n=1 Tax=Roseivirga pacifica TaxID=1267423 RepID=UPI003BA8A5F7